MPKYIVRHGVMRIRDGVMDVASSATREKDQTETSQPDQRLLFHAFLITDSATAGPGDISPRRC